MTPGRRTASWYEIGPHFESWDTYQVRDLAAAKHLGAACLSHV